VVAFVCSYLDQYYSSSTPNFAGGKARRPVAATVSDFGEERRERMGYASSEPEMTTVTAEAPELAMRSDTLQSPRVSPLLWLQRCLLPSLVVTSDIQRKNGE